VASAYGWVTIEILSMVKRAHPLYSNKDPSKSMSSRLHLKDDCAHVISAVQPHGSN
jgi:hypothetical protein